MKVVAFLPVKHNSERIESKNTKLLDGKPLFIHTLEKLNLCEEIDEIYLDTESDEILEIASEVNHLPLKRAPELATNKTDGHQLFYNAARQVDADLYVQILCTSPFISAATIDKAIKDLKTDASFDSAVLIRKEKMYTWDSSTKPNYDPDKIPNSNTLDDTLIETMGLYITNKEVALEQKKRYGKKPLMIEASPLEAVDVNYPEDFEFAEYIMAGIREKSNVKFRNLSRLLGSAMLSDILDDLNQDSFIGGLKLNISGKQILGRAKTVKIRTLKEGEDFRGIYDTLQSYDTVVPGDIIVVENEESNYAYFGSLNASLSIRQGAIGAIIGGNTRDYTEVKNLDFPVFAKGYTARDVRKRATLESINKSICLEGINISPGDLIFADHDGIVVIPKQLEEKVLHLAMETISTENRILQDIAKSIHYNELTQSHGDF